MTREFPKYKWWLKTWAWIRTPVRRWEYRMGDEREYLRHPRSWWERKEEQGQAPKRRKMRLQNTTKPKEGAFSEGRQQILQRGLARLEF